MKLSGIDRIMLIVKTVLSCLMESVSQMREASPNLDSLSLNFDQHTSKVQKRIKKIGHQDPRHAVCYVQ